MRGAVRLTLAGTMTLLRIENLKVSFRDPGGGTSVILDVPTLEMAQGDHVCLAGRSGSGKTTLLNAIAGIRRVDEGVVEVAGTDLAKLSESTRDRTWVRRPSETPWSRAWATSLTCWNDSAAVEKSAVTLVSCSLMIAVTDTTDADTLKSCEAVREERSGAKRCDAV